MEWIWMWMVLLAPAAIIGIMIWRVIRRGYQMRDLVERGKPITGEVVDKVKFRGSSSAGNRFMR